MPLTLADLVKLCSLILLMLVSPHAASQNTAEESHPPRIISLAPHLTEMVYSAGAGAQLIGVVNYSDYPPEAQNLPIIGSYNAINLERIVEMRPDLILTWRSGNRLQDLQRLKALQEKLGFRLHESEIETLEDIPDLIARIGQLAGTQKTADLKARQLRRQLAELRQKYASSEAVSVFYQIWNKPLITMGKNQFISLGIELCGGRNIFDDLGNLTGQVSLETVILRNPQVILLGGQKAFQNDWYQAWQKYPEVRAVKDASVYKLNNDLYQRPTERFIDALAPLCALLEQARDRRGVAAWQ
ncbi:cobalamin-binding protein [Thiomicrorhabdus xiamenensis]|uniref:Cobalamin-binding protein n=1 Tax=Thiomicrorhabdus xiamenensis TaxID=2739063 RepID=A0A7D4NK89_9GAMM|nr:cobalamin-binding protein [Thiomicrorhabdus xiamenensis]QKI89029.1 cobalamin-binding protein [Thiomicrorhabdus xiamenensis]